MVILPESSVRFLAVFSALCQLVVLWLILAMLACGNCIHVAPNDGAHDFHVEESGHPIECISMWSYPDLVMRWELIRPLNSNSSSIEELDYGVPPKGMAQVFPRDEIKPEPLMDDQIVILEIHPIFLMYSRCVENITFWFRKRKDHFVKITGMHYRLPRWESTKDRTLELSAIEDEIHQGQSEFLRVAFSASPTVEQKKTVSALMEASGETDPRNAYCELRTRHELHGSSDGSLVRLSGHSDLILDNLALTDIGPLRDFGNLRSLSLSNNHISDISPLGSLGKLTALDLSGNRIEECSSLSRLGDLSTLDLSHNKIRQLSFATGLLQLTNLKLSDNKLSDLSALAGLNRLEMLRLDSNEIENLSPLRGLFGLGVLSLAENRIVELRPLVGLVHLTYLDLRNNRIKDARPLKRMLNPMLRGNPIEFWPLD
jgi:hypothetical protein